MTTRNNLEMPNQNNFRLFVGVIENHGLLHFSSSEISGLSITYPYLQNTALNYAVSLVTNYVSSTHVPSYADRMSEFLKLPLYTTPAHPTHSPNYVTLSHNSLNDKTSTVMPHGKRNIAGVYRTKCIAPHMGMGGKTGFKTYVFLFDNEFSLPPVFRLGKRHTPMVASWEELEYNIFYSHTKIVLKHLVNPLDVSGDIISGEIIDMPPNFLVRNASIAKDYFLKTIEGEIVHIPDIVIKRIGITGK